MANLAASVDTRWAEPFISLLLIFGEHIAHQLAALGCFGTLFLFALGVVTQLTIFASRVGASRVAAVLAQSSSLFVITVVPHA